MMFPFITLYTLAAFLLFLQFYRKHLNLDSTYIWKLFATHQIVHKLMWSYTFFPERSTVWTVNVKSIANQFYVYSPLKSRSHCLNGLYHLYSERRPLSLDHQFKWGKTCLMEKRVKKKCKIPQEELQRRNPSTRADIYAIDVTCTATCNLQKK